MIKSLESHLISKDYAQLEADLNKINSKALNNQLDELFYDCAAIRLHLYKKLLQEK